MRTPIIINNEKNIRNHENSNQQSYEIPYYWNQEWFRLKMEMETLKSYEIFY